MPQNVTLYRAALSFSGGLIIGAFGLIAGAVWGLGLGAGVLTGALIAGAAGFVWGAICFQLTPTGGAIMENKTTVNYAVIALHGWLTCFVCVLGLLVWAARVWAF